MILKSNLGCSSFKGKSLRMTGFTTIAHLVVFMPEGDGAHFTFFAENDRLPQNWNGFPVTQGAVIPCKGLFPLLVMAGKT